MSRVMESGMEDVSRSRCGALDGRPEGGWEVRWSARRKEEVVLRLLRGETLDALARETGQAAGVPAPAKWPPVVGSVVRHEPPNRAVASVWRATRCCAWARTCSGNRMSCGARSRSASTVLFGPSSLATS